MHRCTCLACLGLVVGGCLLAAPHDQDHAHVETANPFALSAPAGAVAASSRSSAILMDDGLIPRPVGRPATFRSITTEPWFFGAGD